MKLITHESKRPEIKEVFLDFDPMKVWLDPRTQLVIERGDRLGEVADAIKEYFPLNAGERRDLVGYWFALGERLKSKRLGPWAKEEVRSTSSRRYLKAPRRDR